jgi:hypothetical protein
MVRGVQGESSLQRMAIAPVRRALGARRGTSIGHIARLAALVGVPVALILVLAWPMLFTNGDFNEDWAHHLWFIWNQSFALRDNHQPSFFLNTEYSVFYPQYAFYAGTLDVIGGLLSLAAGNAPIETYVLMYLLGFAAAYGGWYWLARAAGLDGWWAHIPGLLFITSAYYLTLIYARGDLAEFMGVSMIPLMVASGLSVLRADRLRLWPALALVIASIVFFGSHNLTVIWGSTFLALMGALVLACIPQARRWLSRRAALRVSILVIPALLVSAWFLLPTIAYESHTQISSEYPVWRLTLRAAMDLVSARNLFAVWPASATSGSEFVLSLPILAMAWSLLSILVCWRARLRGAWVRALLICAGLTALMTVVMTHAGLMLALPRPYAILQYAYRLESYVILAVCGAVLAGLVALRNGTRRTRLWTWLLAPILLVAIAGAIQQTSAYPHDGDRQEAIKSRTKSEFTQRILTDYSDAALPALADRRGHPTEVLFSPSAIHGDRISEVLHVPPGRLVYSNIGGGPELVHVTGAKIVGVDPSSNDVLEIGPGVRRSHASAAGRSQQWTEVVTVSAADGLPVRLGRLLSLASLAFLFALFLVLVVRRAKSADDRASPGA